ncbi:hypothetical protein VHEMI04032 [[Torrubiella] hemipterigena]|uniref:Transcription factor domain-containing protein n=1 Tax=[Torrubiella] hemipterigena TaxID=1531966 RepID=A0A0A1TD06_9HYPO|nr:hypothetical protein VHEMI04032 [[Torrubiella] hemipterigena]
MESMEIWVFEAPELSDNPIASEDEAFTQFKTKKRLDAIRAAHCMVLIMCWEGSEQTIRRARRERYSKIIDVARSLLKVQPTHTNLGDYIQAPNIFEAWKRFVHKEELLRTLSYVFKLDCAYAIFNNCLPRMTIPELQFTLSCPEICFQANSPDEWLMHAKSWHESTIGIQLPNLSDVVRIVLQEELSVPDWRLLQEMSSLNFFAVISALHAIIFHLRHLSLGNVDTQQVHRGLRHWIQAWAHRQTILSAYDKYHVNPHDSWKRVGFMRHVQEYWRLALVFCRQLESDQAGLSESSTCRSVSVGNRSLDETDMRHVHDLIVKFQHVNLGEYDL